MMEMNYTSLQYRFYKVVKYTYKHEVNDTCPIQCSGHDSHGIMAMAKAQRYRLRLNSQDLKSKVTLSSHSYIESLILFGSCWTILDIGRLCMTFIQTLDHFSPCLHFEHSFIFLQNIFNVCVNRIYMINTEIDDPGKSLSNTNYSSKS